MELLAVTDHVEEMRTHDGDESNEAQVERLFDEQEAGNLLVVGDFSLLLSADGSGDLDGSVDRLYGLGPLIGYADEVFEGRGEDGFCGRTRLHTMRARNATGNEKVAEEKEGKRP